MYYLPPSCFPRNTAHVVRPTNNQSNCSNTQSRRAVVERLYSSTWPTRPHIQDDVAVASVLLRCSNTEILASPTATGKKEKDKKRTTRFREGLTLGNQPSSSTLVRMSLTTTNPVEPIAQISFTFQRGLNGAVGHGEDSSDDPLRTSGGPSARQSVSEIQTGEQRNTHASSSRPPVQCLTTLVPTRREE